MRVVVVGCGYLGAVHAACMADLGHDVIGFDVDEDKVADLAAGRAPFHEPGLAELLARAGATGRLRFTADVAELAGPPHPSGGETPDGAGAGGPAGADDEATVYFVCVGTPQRSGEFAADTSYVDAAVTLLLPVLSPGDLVVGKSDRAGRHRDQAR